MSDAFRPQSMVISRTTPTPVAGNCVHHRVCGDELIERAIPGYFDTHPHAQKGYENQVCLQCGHSLVVVLWWKRERRLGA